MIVKSILALSTLISLGICWLTGSFSALSWLWVLPVSFGVSFLVLAFGAFLYLYLLCRGVDTSIPQEHDDPLFRKLISLYSEAICWVLRMRVHTVGLEKVPQNTRFVLTCNHLFELDPVVIYYCFQKSQLAFISKKENTDMFMIGQAMHRLMAQLINRENDREALKTILKCVQLLKDDEVSIAVFPEGYISKDHHLQKLRAGSLKIATKAKVPIAVCTIQGTDKVVGNLKRLRHTDIEMHLLDVITPEQQAGRTATDIADQIYQMMAADLGPDYAPLEAENP